MFRTLFGQKKTRGPVLGIIIITVFVALGASLLVLVQQQGKGAEAGADTNLPNVVGQAEERDIFFEVVEGQNIQINAASPNERMRIVVAAPAPPTVQVVEATAVPPAEVAAEDAAAKPEVQLTSTPAPLPQSSQPIVVQVTTTFGEDQTAADAAPAPTAAVIAQVNTNNLIAYVNHTVSAGQTIYFLTTQYNTSVTMLSEGGISEADMVPGNVLNIPYANNAACVSGRAYPIREGDNLFRIGINNNTTAAILQQINGIDASYSIDAGSALCLP